MDLLYFLPASHIHSNIFRFCVATCVLFVVVQEAYKMVDEAKGGKVSAEKRLADAAGKMDAMETEMSTLKRIMQSSQNPPQARSVSKTTGASLNTLHLPQSHSPSQKHIKRSSIKRAVHKIQKRTG